jgi:hypothetical protein
VNGNVHDEIKLKEADLVVEFAKECFGVVNQILLSAPARYADSAERTMKVNDRATAFLEKLILLDGATIALSLSFIGALVPRLSHIPRVSFVCLVCPAWCLLLLSVFSCWVRMGAIQLLAISNIETTRAQIEKVQIQQMKVMMEVLLSRARQAVVEPVTRSDLNDAFQEMERAVAQVLTGSIDLWEKQSSESAGKAKASYDSTTPVAKVALCSTALAFILLCAFAVRAVLLF